MHEPTLLYAYCTGYWAECTCGWATRETRYSTSIGAHLAFGRHLIRMAGKPRCGHCGQPADGSPAPKHHTCAERVTADGLLGTARYKHEEVCDVPWSDDVCPRCWLYLELDMGLRYDAERVSKRMLTAS